MCDFINYFLQIALERSVLIFNSKLICFNIRIMCYDIELYIIYWITIIF